MRLVDALSMLESIRKLADDGQDSIGGHAAAVNIIHILVEFIDNAKIREKVDEIPF